MTHELVASDIEISVTCITKLDRTMTALIGGPGARIVDRASTPNQRFNQIPET